MEIMLEGIRNYSVSKYFESEDGNVYCSRGGTTSLLTLKDSNIYIVDGPLFTKDLRECGADVAEMKALAFRIFKEHLGFDDYLREINAAREEGRQKGVKDLKCAFKELMDLE